MWWLTLLDWAADVALASAAAAWLVLQQTPAPPTPGEGHAAMTVTADQYGQFHVTATANENGAVFNLLADTGASDVVFRKRDAALLGLNPARLVFDRTYSTANGTVRGASFRLHRLVIGSCVLTDIPASINEGDLEQPLLGMSLLRQMKVTVANGVMTLHCKQPAQ